ncbi:MAG: protein-S-isoprenylcysteine O-methyltransferase [Hyphomicrobiales bacterium]|jgi:protein-S-isoprenylcysteine O-methyltransferase Ste14|nr:protein-S-isoprenylcysteine O-methyltransferase [Hyphomicrobiales bacterium]
MTLIIARISWLVLVAGWYILRVPFARKARKARIARDEMTLAEKLRLSISLSGLGLIPFVFVAFREPRFANYPASPVLCGLGIAVALVALVMFHLTHKALGRYWSVSLQMREDHKLITTGIYARIRHPMYTAFWLMALAQALLLPNWIAGFSGLVGFGILYVLRVGQEERIMLDTFGAEYQAYMDRTGRLLPKF